MKWVKSLFGNKSLPPFDLSKIGADMHSHLIPGIDDGAQNMEESIGMLLKLSELGYKKVITTPHIMTDTYKNNPKIILKGLENVRAEIKKLNIPITIDAAAEYFNDEFLMEKVENKELMTFGDNYVLFEFSFSSVPTNKNELIFAFINNGYTPVLAHFERYLYFAEQGIKIVEELKGRGAKIQLNLNSLSGHYGKVVKKQAEMLIDNKLVDFVGTDCHRMDHLHLLELGLTNPYFHKLADLKLLNHQL